MSILTLLVALLLSGSTGLTVHTNGVSGGGPTEGIQAGTTSNPPTPSFVYGGGPTE